MGGAREEAPVHLAPFWAGVRNPGGASGRGQPPSPAPPACTLPLLQPLPAPPREGGEKGGAPGPPRGGVCAPTSPPTSWQHFAPPTPICFLQFVKSVIIFLGAFLLFFKCKIYLYSIFKVVKKITTDRKSVV